MYYSIRVIYLTLIVWGVFISRLQAQSGCTDPQAINFNANATTNDGSCEYPVTTYSLQTKTPLSTTLNETSGLQMAGGALWTHNDGGSEPKIFRIDTITNTIEQTVTIGGAVNNDWEDIAFDGAFFYIGDFGNNANGNRTDLKIYKFPLSAIPAGSDVTVPASAVSVIEFSYEDQTDFTPQGANNTRFDCEAMIYRDGELHLFTKDWISSSTAHYVLPAVEGTYVAQNRESYFVNGLITGADISHAGVVILLGYQPFAGNLFFWMLFDYSNSAFFSGNKRRVALGSVLTAGQAEGICFRDNGYGYVSNEQLSVLVPARLYGFQVSQWLQSPFLPAYEWANSNGARPCAVQPNPVPAGQPLVLPDLTERAQISLWDTSGRRIWDGLGAAWQPITLPAGAYQVTIRTDQAGTCSSLVLIK